MWFGLIAPLIIIFLPIQTKLFVLATRGDGDNSGQLVKGGKEGTNMDMEEKDSHRIFIQAVQRQV